MSTLATGNYPSVSFKDGKGVSVTGTIIEFNDSQVTEYNTNKPKFWGDGKPMMQTVITLEKVPGDQESRVALFVKPGRMRNAVRDAIKLAGGKDIEEGAILTVTCTGEEAGKGANPAKTYYAKYEPFDPTVSPGFAGKAPF